MGNYILVISTNRTSTRSTATLKPNQKYKFHGQVCGSSADVIVFRVMLEGCWSGWSLVFSSVGFENWYFLETDYHIICHIRHIDRESQSIDIEPLKFEAFQK